MAYTVTENGSSFDRGVAAGEIAQRLKEHDKHFDKINGSMDNVARELAALNSQMQRMNDARAADQVTVLTTAAALEKERESTAKAVENERVTRRDLSERRWSPLARWGTFISIIAGIAGTVAIVLTLALH